MTQEMVDDIPWMSATHMSEKVRQRELSPVDIAESMTGRIKDLNPRLNAYVAFDEGQVLQDAHRLEKEAESGANLGPLHGVPFSIKELTAMRGLPATYGYLPLKNTVATHDAAVVRRLKAAGGLFLGKTNMPEGGYYGGTDSHLYGATHNPWKHGYSAGGSSGGGAAAVAAGLGPIAEGSDGAGSVRIPAAMCGVVGMKPTHGLIPQTILGGRYYSWIYHGPIARTVADAALMLNVMAGPDDEDPTSLPRIDVDFTEEIKKPIAGWRVAWSPDLGLGYVDPEVAAICGAAMEAFEELGAIVQEATPAWEGVQETMWNGVWLPGFASQTDLLDWPRLKGQVDDNLIEIMRECKGLTGVDKGRADLSRGQMWTTFREFMSGFDLLVSPTLSSSAFPLDQFTPKWLEGKPLREQILGWLLTYPFNMLTTPSITVPAGFTSQGLPVGLHIAGGFHSDANVLRAAAAFESVRPWAQRRPAPIQDEMVSGALPV
ncbi:amidase [Arthrobacter globiformis]|uniref:amidase n=1 Tax=Arthrobacter globiformis TaxID=1665 RepID=UPI00278A83DD|nr:amidase family protein [Arthrobacter globiformis]MDQ0864615.1 Asp-tRNA(Asn)/Glu-tRNA(Gln) amidotransferase A subunit family amidase [Arthrobacter globiformis]